MTEYSREAGDAAKTDGMNRAYANAGEEYREKAATTIHRLARENDFVTADDVSKIIGDPPSRTALGPALNRACGEKWIENTKVSVPSTRASSHSGPRTLYRSLLRGTTTRFHPTASKLIDKILGILPRDERCRYLVELYQKHNRGTDR